MRRACLFSFHDPQGIVDGYVVFFLEELREFVERIIFLSGGPLSKEAERALGDIVDELIVRADEGDVMAYKAGLERIEFNRSGAYDEVLMVDASCYGPMYPFSELFGEMERRSCDFWGVAARMATTPDLITGSGTLAYHLSTDFIAVRREMLQSKSFGQYWQRFLESSTSREAILNHETIFTEYFTNLGYKCESYLQCEKYGTHDPELLDIDETLIDRSPLFKREALMHDPRLFEYHGADVPRALRVIEKTSGYDRALIWRNVVRSAELRTLNTNAALTSVLPDVRIKQNEPLPEYGRIAVCAHVYYTDLLEEILAYAGTIPVTSDFIVTTDTLEKKEIIEKRAHKQKNIGSVIVRIVEQSRGRDMSALFINCRDLFLDGPYDLVCKVHTKKSPQVTAGRANLFKRHMFENLLNSRGFTTNVLDMFQDSPWVGVAVPPAMQIAYYTLGRGWSNHRSKAEEIKKLIDLKVPFDPDTSVAAFGGMFWFRPKALRKLFEHKWEWTDFEGEPHPVDGGLAHVLERLICYVAQDAGYTTQQILSSDQAGWNYALLEYKLQKLAAALPSPMFADHCRELEEWKRAEYPGWLRGSATDCNHSGVSEVLRQEYLDRIQSFSWQLTSPLRLVDQLIRGQLSQEPPCFWRWSDAYLKQRISSLERSMSWKLTAPFRLILNFGINSSKT